MTAYSSYFVGRAEQDFAPTASTGSKELDKEAFLNLLVAQLGNQDPLNPVEDKEFTAQLAQFSSLEQLTSINEGIQDMSDNMSRQEMLTAVSFIGKSVRADGYSLSKSDESTSTLYYTLEEPVAEFYINIYDSAGELVRTINAGAMQAGFYQFDWDGQDYTGADTPNGLYQVAITARDADGGYLLVDTEVSGEVAGVQSVNGQHYLRLVDGRVVNFMDVTEVVDPGAGSSDDSDTGGDGSDTSGDGSDTSGDGSGSEEENATT